MALSVYYKQNNIEIAGDFVTQKWRSTGVLWGVYLGIQLTKDLRMHSDLLEMFSMPR
jgi:hypothetical protein